MYRVFSPAENIISPMIATIPAYCGKFCLMWPSLVALFTNKEIRNKLLTKDIDNNQNFNAKV
jgi:hypothetical protein